MIHKFIFDDTRIVLDVHSGAVHVMDEMAWEIMDHYPSLGKEGLLKKYAHCYEPASLNEAVEEIESLVKEGLLFSEDPYKNKYEPLPGGIIKALCLHLAHDCNFRCRYCFAGQGHFGGPAGLMPADVGRRAIDFLIKNSGSRKHIEVDFFGGEPLLNFPVLKELVEYGRERAREKGKEIKFTVTTNALLLNDEVGRYLNDNNLSVVLSLDGREDVHDAMRPLPGGAGTYRKVLENITRFLESRAFTDYYVRGTFTRKNLDFAEDVLHIAKQGFHELSVEPVVAPYEEEYALRPEDVQAVCLEYERLTTALLEMIRAGQGVNFFHFNIDLDGGPCLPKRLSGCGAGHEYLAVAPDGSLYPCHQFVGRSGYLMGDVSQGVTAPQLSEQFRQAHIYNKESCPDCWAKFHCSGGCHANAQAFNGSLRKPYELGCQLAKKRLECALYLKAMLAEV